MLNDLTAQLLDKPSIYSPYCAVCGAVAGSKHHVIIKGMGGSRLEKRIPTIALCGTDNRSGCHGLAHSMRLHFRFREWWECIITDEPCDYQTALGMEGWRAL